MKCPILLIGDDKDLLETYEEALKTPEYTIITADTGEKGLELFEKNRPCVVFSDIKMPDMDGYELFEKIHELDPLAKVILFSSYEDPKKTENAKKKGLIDVRIKPMGTSEIMNIIEKIDC